MITLYTTMGCTRCKMVKGILEKRGIQFESHLLESLPAEKQNELLAKAEAAGIMSFPLIEKEDGTITNRLEEI